MIERLIRNVLMEDDSGNWYTICPNCHTKHNLADYDALKPNLRCCHFQWRNYDITGDIDPGWEVIKNPGITSLIKANC